MDTAQKYISKINENELVRDYFLLKPEALRRRTEVLQFLIDHGPVVYIPEVDVYTITGYQALHNVAKRTEDFTSRHATGQRVGKNYKTGLLNADPPVHDKRRKIIAKAFTNSKLKKLEPQIKAIVDETIDEFYDAGRFDMVLQFALPITTKVMLQVLGISFPDIEKFKRWAILHAGPVGNPGFMQKQSRSFMGEYVEFKQYFGTLIDKLRETPDASFLSLLSNKIADDYLLTKQEIILILRQTLSAGIETPSRFLQCIFEILLKNPAQFEEIAQNFSLIPNMIEESMRINTPSHGMFRTAVKDTEVAGYKIPKDAMLLLMFSSAGLNENTFSCPYQLDIYRKNAARHRAFGIGVHRCPGAQLSKLLGKVVVESLLARAKNITIAPDNVGQPHRSYVFHGFQSFHLVFDKK